MTTVKDVILQTDFKTVSDEFLIHHGDKHIEKIKEIYSKLCNAESKTNRSNMIIFIRAIKENDQGDEDIVINDFDLNDNTLMFDICGKDDEYDGLYSIGASEYNELLGYYVDPLTFNRFSCSQIIAHVIWDLYW